MRAFSLPSAPAAQKSIVQDVPTVQMVRAATRVHCTAAGTSKETEQGEKKFDARKFRRSLNSTGRYVRKPSNDAESVSLMESHGVSYSRTGLVAKMREEGHVWKQDGLTIHLAEAFGFCWGVERAVQMAYEAVRAFPGKKLHITNEIIHNPEVNQRMRDMGYRFIETVDKKKDFSGVERGDVVVLPAFGATVQEMKLLNDREVQIIDTTCPWVSKVWNAVDNQARKSHTSIIHGKWSHEETVATASFAGDYVIVKDIKEAQYVCDYILNGGSKEEFLEKFKNAISKGFDPDTMLGRVGLANQTTMLKGETQKIGKMLERTMMVKYGPDELSHHFMVLDTICDATQERQDAMYQLTGDDNIKLDMFIIVGGFNSSNTSHLQEIAENAGIPSFWVDCAARIDAEENRIVWKNFHHELKETADWIPKTGQLTIGISSGASTPDKAIEDILEKVFRIRNMAAGEVMVPESVAA